MFVVSENFVGSSRIVVGQGRALPPDSQQLAAPACARHTLRHPLQAFAQGLHNRLIQAFASALSKQVGERVGLRVIHG